MMWRAARRDNAGVHGCAWVPLVTAAEAAAFDAAARADHSVPEPVLMETAGRSAAHVLHRAFPRGAVAVVVGGGNNGGDGIVLARTLASWGRSVRILSATDKPLDTTLLHGADLEIEKVSDLSAALVRADVIVDGLLGTGTEGAPRAGAAATIDVMNGAGRPILALDLPSGVDATTGAIAGACVRAHLTVTFGWPKIGLLLQPARSACGRLVVVEIGFPPLARESARAALITPEWANALRPRRPPDAHKGTAGRLLIVAGGHGMAGAAVIAAEAARSAGTGLVRLASAAGNREIVQSAVPEATYLEFERIPDSDVDAVHAVLAGPGLGTDEAARSAVENALDRTGSRPIVLDADALNLCAAGAFDLAAIGASRPLVITPHAKELERLTEIDLNYIVNDPPAAARAAAERFGCAVLLKGMPSIVATPDGFLRVNSVGSSDLAAGGMGDQLAGVIGAFLAGGLDPADAAAAALFFCGRAADIAGRGPSLGPRDVSRELHRAFERPSPRHGGLGLPFVTFDQPPRR